MFFPISGKKGWVFPLTISPSPSENEVDSASLKAFESAVYEKLPEHEREVKISFQPCTKEGDENRSVRIKVTSKVFKVIQELLYNGDVSKSFQLKLAINTRVIDTESAVAPVNHLLDPDAAEGASPTYTTYSVLTSRLSRPFNRNRPGQHPAVCRMQLEIDADNYINLVGVLPPLEEKNQQIFEEQQFCDFQIISEEGNVFPCHRIFLSRASSVLAGSISDKFREGREGKLEMHDISDKSISAFLEFIYYNSVKAPQQDSLIAWELLKASDFYNIPSLWTAMSRIILAKESKWFNVDDALRLFDYVSKQTDGSGMLELKRKLTKVLAVKIDQLDGSEVFKKTFPTVNCRDMFKSSLEGSN